MPSLQESFEKFLGVKDSTFVDKLPNEQGEIRLFKTDLDRKINILSSIGLSDYAMPYRANEENQPHVELCFALPSYWDLEFKTENSVWPVEKLKFLCDFVVSRNTHFWDGHTMANANPNRAISETMKQQYFFFSKSLLFEGKLTQFEHEGKIIHLLFLIPLFQNEWDYKQARGINALKKKLVSANYGEILDDFRDSAIKRRFGLF